MSFRLYTGNKLERLAEKFIEIIVESPHRDVFTPETVVVQTRGMASWLKLKIGENGRIAANIDTPFLVNFVNRTLESLFSSFHADFKQFSAETLPWRICRLLREKPATFPELASYLDPALPQKELKEWQLSCRIAELFDQYQLYRPDMLMHWSEDGAVEWSDAEWQKRLYRELRGESFLREDCFTEFFKLTRIPASGALPERITIFGVGTMPPRFLDFFLKLAEFTEINFFYLNPSREYWADQYSNAEAARFVARDGGELAAFHDGNPLLASFGAQGREFFRCICNASEVIRADGGELFESFLETRGNGPDDYVNPTRLAALQQDIYAMFRRAPDGDGEITGKPLTFPKEDRSVRVHNCHSARREIEVLHDQLLELLESPEIQPRDVIVMAPDINVYTPYIRSIFGQGALKRSYAISDRSLRSDSRIAECFFELLKLRSGRVEASKIMELLHVPSLRNRFRIATDELDAIAAWIEEAGIRWGIDADDRLKSCSIAFDEYSWRQGLDRLLLGFAREQVPEDLLSEGLLPLDAIGDNAALLGKFITAVETMFTLRRDSSVNRTPEDWSKRLLRAVDDFFLASEEDFEEIAALRRAVQTPGREAAAAGFTAELPIEVIEEIVASSLSSTGRNDPFLRGKITFCSLVPMRSIPMQVVAILGLNDGNFPRHDLKTGFNLVKRKSAACDRSPQAEDRYLFLEAIQSARKCLMLFYQGQSARGNEEFPPAIPLGELIEYLKASDKSFEVIRHRLQPFELSYFNRNNPNPDARSRSPENFDAAQSLLESLRKPAAAPNAGLENLRPLSEPSIPELLAPEGLERFFTHPCRWFLNNCAGIFPQDVQSGLEDAEPTPETIDNLQKYLLRSEISAYTLSGIDRDTQYRLLRRRCRLPVGTGGERLFAELYESVASIPDDWMQMLREQEPFPVRLEVDELRIAGTLTASPGGSRQMLLFFSEFKFKHAVRALLRHTLLTLAGNAPVTTAVLNIGRDGNTLQVLDPVECEKARQALKADLALFREGLVHPLPFFENASWAYHKKPDYEAARNAFQVNYRGGGARGDFDDPAVSTCYRPEAFDDPDFQKKFILCANVILGAFPFREEAI